MARLWLLSLTLSSRPDISCLLMSSASQLAGHILPAFTAAPLLAVFVMSIREGCCAPCAFVVLCDAAAVSVYLCGGGVT